MGTEGEKKEVSAISVIYILTVLIVLISFLFAMNGDRSKPSVATTTPFKLRPHTLSMFLAWKNLAILGLALGYNMLYLRNVHTHIV